MTDDSSLHLSDPLPEPRRYASKIDAWLALLLIATAAFVIVIVIASGAPAWVLLVAAIPQALVLWIFARTYYLITDTALEAHSGPFNWSVPLARIRSLAASRNPLSAPALSLDRIAVRHTSGLLLISPTHKATFVHAMTLAVPNLEVTGLAGADGVVPDEHESTFSVAGIVPAAVVTIAAFAFGGWSLYSSLREPVVTLTPESIVVDAYYEEEIRRSDVVRVALEDTLPGRTKHQGFSGFDRLRGYFDVEGRGRALVFITEDRPPYVVIDTTSQPLIVNYSDPARTRDLYERLLSTWGLEGPHTRPAG